eukprot:Sspe_Gene.66817::Locus_39481_Transcript_1_1_Confidence_1.000_Length_1557::g.66817::m.66817/K14948/PTBP2, NPTB; polypyrimidine tract-binding protein 2
MSGPVVMVRNLPKGTDDFDLVRLGCCVAPVVKTMVMKKSNYGFIEFDSVASANHFLEKANSEGMVVRYEPVVCGPSKFPALTEGATVVTQELLAQLGIIGGMAAGSALASSGTINASSAVPRGGRVLHVQLQDLVVEIKVDDLYFVFTNFGTVEKICFFERDGKNLILVQMGSPAEAEAALRALDRQYVGCCTFLVQHSKLEQLVFNKTGPNSRDYLLGGPPPVNPANPLTAGANGAARAQPFMGFAAARFAGGPMEVGGISMQPAVPQQPFVVIVSGLNEYLTLNHLWELAGKLGDIVCVKILYNHRDKCLMHFADVKSGREAMQYLNGLTLCGTTLRANVSKVAAPFKANKDEEGLVATAESHKKHKFNPKNVVPPSETLHVSVSREGVPKEYLVDLFQQYGTVTGFEFFKQKKNLCIVRMESLTHALNAIVGLNGYQIQMEDGGTAIVSIGFSKHQVDDSAPRPQSRLAALDAIQLPM